MADRRCRGGRSTFGTVGEPAWKSKPSWYLVATEDQMIPPPAQQAMAQRAGSTKVEQAGSHSVYVSHPQEVAALIQQAAQELAVPAPQGNGASKLGVERAPRGRPVCGVCDRSGLYALGRIGLHKTAVSSGGKPSGCGLMPMPLAEILQVKGVADDIVGPPVRPGNQALQAHHGAVIEPTCMVIFGELEPGHALVEPLHLVVLELVINAAIGQLLLERHVDHYSGIAAGPDAAAGSGPSAARRSDRGGAAAGHRASRLASWPARPAALWYRPVVLAGRRRCRARNRFHCRPRRGARAAGCAG